MGRPLGGWCSVAVKRLHVLAEKRGQELGHHLLGSDLQEMEAQIQGARLHQLDFMGRRRNRDVKGWLGAGRCGDGRTCGVKARAHKNRLTSIAIIACCASLRHTCFDVLEDARVPLSPKVSGPAGRGRILQSLLKRRFAKVAKRKAA